METETSAGIVVYNEEEGERKYLILHYSEKHWDLPKGHIEPGETLKQTAKRETLEETGLTVEPQEGFEEIIVYNYTRNGNLMEKTVHFFTGKTKETKVIISHEHIGYEWLNYDDAIEKVTYKTAKNVLRKAHEFLF